MHILTAANVLAWFTKSDYQMPWQDNDTLWTWVGYVGIGLFFSRFFVQWLYSEAKGESRVPVLFWWQSVAGAVVMLAYTLRQHDPPLVLGYLFTVVPYTRNLVLIYRKRRRQEG